MQMKCNVDMREFQEALNEYKKFNKRAPAEVTNAKAYFICLNALKDTKRANADAIRQELNQPSTTNPRISLGHVIVQTQMKNNGKMPKKFKTFAKNLGSYINKLINKRISHIGFLASGWLPAIIKLDYWNKRGDIKFSKKYAPKRDGKIKQFGREKGKVIPAKNNDLRAKTECWNQIGEGSQATTTVLGHLRDGLDKAIRKEAASMRDYVMRKYREQHEAMQRKYRGSVKAK